MIRYLKTQIDEIKLEPLLQIYGLFIALTHALTLVHLVQKEALSLFEVTAENICWPFFSSCNSASVLTGPFMQGLLIAYGFLVLATIAAFVVKRVTLAYGFLFVLLIFKSGLLSLSYQFSSSVHLVSQIVLLCWLFAPAKAELIRLILVASSVVFGLNKLTQEWMTGAALPVPLDWPSAPLLALLFVAPLVEIIMALGLLVSRRAVQATSLIALSLWQLLSMKIFGVIEPALMLVIFSIFFLNLILWEQNRNQLLDQILEAKLRRSHLMVLGVFCFLQVVPFFFSRNPSLNGATNLFSIRLAHHRMDCSALIQYQDERGQNVQSNPFDVEGKGVLRCDPLVYLNQVRNLCERQPLADARLVMFSKKRTEQNFVQVLDVDKVCEHSNLLWAEVIR